MTPIQFQASALFCWGLWFESKEAKPPVVAKHLQGRFTLHEKAFQSYMSPTTLSGGVDGILLEIRAGILLRVPAQAIKIQFKVAPCLARVEKDNLK